jgi:hypothetical protein
MADLPRLTADRDGDLRRDDGHSLFYAGFHGVGMGAEVARRCNDYPALVAERDRLLELARDVAASQTQKERWEVQERAGVLSRVPLREGPGLTDDDDWRLEDALNGRR